MGNPLDFVTEDQSQDDPTAGLQRVMVYGDPQTPEGDAMVPRVINAPLAAAIAPEPPSDLMKGLALLKDRLLGTGGQERFQTWPERMVRSAVDAPHAAMTSEEPVTSEQMVAPAQDIAGLASGSTLFSKPGAGTLGSGAMRPGTRPVPTEPAPVFYSALEHAATNAAQDTMSPQQWLGYLKNQPGVKKEELEWSGLEGWLGGQKGKVKKEDVQQYLDAHKTEIKDVTKGVDANTPHVTYEDVRAAERRADWPEMERLQEIYEAQELNQQGDTKYSSYQLPGGENYREHLLTLPQKDRYIPWSREKGDRLHELDRKNEQGMLTEKELEEHIKLNAEANARDRAPEPYQSSHWDEPNVLAHVRTNDRHMPGDGVIPESAKLSDADALAQAKDWVKHGGEDWDKIGKVRQDAWVAQVKKTAARHAEDEAERPRKSLHIEEIQSDWHQQGRNERKKEIKKLVDQGVSKAEAEKRVPEDFGYKTKPLDGPSQAVVRETPTGNYWEVQSKDGRFITNVTNPETTTAEQAIAEAVRRLDKDPRRTAADNRVPDAPFKSSWPELTLKRMIRHAAENGYDRISWTPGEAQAARYDLSKTIDSVWWSPEGHMLQAYKDGKVVMNHEGVPPEKLADYVGKEAAEKLVNSPTKIMDLGKAKRHELSGLDLKVGGEGMREFYDKMLPKMAEKIGKAHGVKVKRTEIESGLATAYEGPELTPKQLHDMDPVAKRLWPVSVRTQLHDVTNAVEHGMPFQEAMDKHGSAMLAQEVGGKQIQKPKTEPVHYFDLPQSLKDHAVGKGFPLYMSGVPFPLTPVDHDPFAKKKEK